MPSINDVFGSGELLKAADLPPNQQCYVRIESVSHKSFDDGDKLLIRFVGKHKAMVCNLTNARTIAAMLGQDFETWAGNEIIIISTFTDFKGDLVPCVRVVPTPDPVPEPGPQLRNSLNAPPASEFKTPAKPANTQAPLPLQGSPEPPF